MGKKYIIEIPDDKIADFVGSTHFLMPYMMAGHIGHHDTGLPIEPYTEPDLDAIRKDEYNKGFQAGSANTSVVLTEGTAKKIRQEGYDKGFSDAMYNCHESCSFLDDAKKEAYQRGLNDAREGKASCQFCEYEMCSDRADPCRICACNYMNFFEPKKQEKEEDSRLRRSIKNVMSACDCSLDEIAEFLKKMREES